ncbi:CRE-NHR-236 protein [Caenorhabditis remanei]|uniref:CRE-NHR-236 protein n=1 Tax=Caenorhabditis remanei TaxID=31234 RepID=E3NH71_CAERE|nr:CRE-NHR-236 protein [Caenorhabditis remanei]
MLMLCGPEPPICRIAQALLKREVLNYDDVKQLIGTPKFGDKHVIDMVENVLPKEDIHLIFLPAVQHERLIPPETPTPTRPSPPKPKKLKVLTAIDQPQDPITCLSTVIHWWSSLPPANTFPASDRRIIFSNCWHSLFLFHIICQPGANLINGGSKKCFVKIKINISDCTNEKLRSIYKTIKNMNINVVEQWAITVVLIYRAEDGRLESKQDIIATQIGAMQILAENHAARVFQSGSNRCAQLLLIPLTIIQISEAEIRETFFKNQQDLEVVCRMAVH